ncbi:MAG: DegT/DnrJ/EryC1/StrS family aminotransferase [Burkholderiaceae bacterium]|nr:DegT/DnrJ/EryC1/StrS family aminotransferase [Burkholderiaceae bacterium]
MQFIDLQTQYAALKPEIDRRIQAVLDHGQYIMGPEVRELEERLEQFTGSKHCITVASGTEALLIALMALGIGRGDEVITTPFTFVATAEMIVLLGATPMFVDVDPSTGNIDASRIEERITARTRAIMPVALYGQPADMDEINAVASRHGLPVIEDAAQSFGAEYKGRKSCNLSTIGCTSFFPSKPLGCYGDGGAIFTSDEALSKKMREIRVHGQERRYHHTSVGVGGRMDTLQCAVVLAKLARFDWETAERQRKARRYLDLLRNAPTVTTLPPKPGRTTAWAQFTVLCDDRTALQQRLSEAGIPTAIHYPVPLHRQPAYRELGGGEEYPVASSMAQRVLSLPMSADLKEDDQQRVCSVIANGR